MIPDVTWSCECGEVLKVPSAKAGTEYQCPKCRQRGWVPVPKAVPKRKPVAKKQPPKDIVPLPVKAAAKGFFASVFSLDSVGGFLAVVGVIGLVALLNWWMLSYLWTR
jgi:hypothetical protein